MRAARELRAAAAERGGGEKIKTTQSWRGKKYKIKKLKRGCERGGHLAICYKSLPSASMALLPGEISPESELPTHGR